MKLYIGWISAVLAAVPALAQQQTAPQAQQPQAQQPAAQAQPTGEKRRVAILDFSYGTVVSSVQAVFGTNQDDGRGISDLLVNQLVNDGTYRVIERQALDKILKEQNFSNSDRAD